DAEFVSYALVEFDQADLLWRYTPARADGNDHLRPSWTLLAIKATEGSISPPSAQQKLPVLTVTEPSAFPKPDELWAYGHAQIEGDLTGGDPKAEIKDAIKGQPGLSAARLMSSRLLQPSTEYIACVVPTFERGRRVGLGELSSDDTTDALLGW